MDIVNACPPNPFQTRISCSEESIRLMQVLSEARQGEKRSTLSPKEILQAVEGAGYQLPPDSETCIEERAAKCLSTIQQICLSEQISSPTVEHLCVALARMGYLPPEHADHQDLDQSSRLTIDTRYGAEDHREIKTNRRRSPPSSVIETLDLKPEEQCFLDGLVDMRRGTGRGYMFAEEILGVAWSIGYRPVDDSGVPADCLTQKQARRLQASFTSKLESTLASKPAGYFVTVRTLLEMIGQIGFRMIADTPTA